MSRARYDGLDLFRSLSMFSVVLLHVHVLSGGDQTDVILMLRDFAFPGLIMGSFFVMAVSFDRNPARPLGTVVRNRVMRLLVPSLVWSYLYWMGWWWLRPWLLGQPAVMPPLSLALTSYMHLWFLHMVFGATVVLAPVLGWVARGQVARWPVFAACAAIAVWCAVWLEPRLLALTLPLKDVPVVGVAYPAPDLLGCIERAGPFLAYIPAGLAIGLAHGPINRWYESAAFRIGTVVAVVVTLVVHISPLHMPLSREVYAVAVFVAILRPIQPHPFVWARALARWSFVVYILHFAGAIAFSSALHWAGIARTEFTSVGGAVLIVALSLAAGAVLRRVLPFDWLLPLVPVTSQPARESQAA